jgi:tetratricopeptide (TPR) repeat protein
VANSCSKSTLNQGATGTPRRALFLCLWMFAVEGRCERKSIEKRRIALLVAPISWEGQIVRRFLYLIAGFGLVAGSIENIAQTKPAQEPPVRQTALNLEQQGKLEQAEAAWRSIVKTHPNDPEAYAHIGLLEARQERYKEAVPYYRKALAIDPNVSALRLDLGLALFKTGQLKEAIPEFKRLLKGAPEGSPEAHRLTILLGMAYYGLADYANAVPYLKTAADSEPNNLPLLLALAHSYLWSKQSKYVLDVYRQILTLDPASAEADMLAGEALDEMKDNAGATQMFRDAVKANPKEPNVHFGLGYLLWTQKKYPEAVSEFNAELANDPNHVQSLLYLADSDIQMNQMEAARPLLEKVIKLDSSIPLAHLDLGIVNSEQERNEDALRELLVAEKMMPSDVNVHWRLGRLYRTMGKKEEAKAEFDKASSLNKAADEDLYKKISAGNARPPQSGAQADPAQPATNKQN